MKRKKNVHVIDKLEKKPQAGKVFQRTDFYRGLKQTLMSLVIEFAVLPTLPIQ